MPRTSSFVLAALACLTLLALAPAAHANGILVPGNGAEIDIRRPHTHPPRRRRSPVSLQDHRVTAKIDDQVAEVTVEQVFRNHTSRQLEGTYLFPLPEGATVSQWAMTMGGKMIQGEIMEAGKARRIYEDIVRRRRDPGLLEYLGRGLFRARVFPIMPNSDLTIRLTFQQVLPEDGSTIEFRYPLSTERFNATPVPNVVVDVQIQSQVALKGVYSPTHNVSVSRRGDHSARVSYERAGSRQDKDLLLYISRSANDVGFSVQSHKEPGLDGTFMMVLAPRTEVKAADLLPKDVVFVLDTSGSMAGDKIEQAKKALAYGVRILRPEDRFNVLGFATDVNPFRDGLQPASKEMREAAVRWIDGLTPAGGTNIHDALLKALAMRGESRLFHVVFLTDGKPTIEERDPAKIVAKVKAANSGNTRVFTFGVGYDVDVNLLDQIAEVTHGARDYVRPTEDIEVVTGRFFRKVEQPVLSDVTIEYGSGVKQVYPKRMPDFFAGGQVVVFGRYAESGDRTIRLKGKVGDREVVFEHRASLRNAEGAGYLPRLWAQRKIAFVLDEIRLHGANKELIDEVVRLATKHAIVTPYTAGLVVEEGELERLGPRGPRDSANDAWGGRTRGTAGGARPLGGLVPRAARAAGEAAPSAPAAEAGARKAADSEALQRMKDGVAGDDDELSESDQAVVDAVRELVRNVGGKVFHRKPDGRWVDRAHDGKAATTQVEAYSAAYFELLAKDKRIAKYLALGERVVFVLGDVTYEVTPAAAR